jgi:hypothetical protein
MGQDLFDERAKNSNGHRTLTLEITTGELPDEGESERVQEKEEKDGDGYLNGWMERLGG